MKGINPAFPIIAGKLQKICNTQQNCSILLQFNIKKNGFLLNSVFILFRLKLQSIFALTGFADRHLRFRSECQVICNYPTMFLFRKSLFNYFRHVGPALQSNDKIFSCTFNLCGTKNAITVQSGLHFPRPVSVEVPDSVCKRQIKKIFLPMIC